MLRSVDDVACELAHLLSKATDEARVSEVFKSLPGYARFEVENVERVRFSVTVELERPGPSRAQWPRRETAAEMSGATVSSTGDVHVGCGGVWRNSPDVPDYIDRCDKCGEERA